MNSIDERAALRGKNSTWFMHRQGHNWLITIIPDKGVEFALERWLRGMLSYADAVEEMTRVFKEYEKAHL